MEDGKEETNEKTPLKEPQSDEAKSKDEKAAEVDHASLALINRAHVVAGAKRSKNDAAKGTSSWGLGTRPNGSDRAAQQPLRRPVIHSDI